METKMKVSELVEFVNSYKFDEACKLYVNIAEDAISNKKSVVKAIEKINNILANIKFVKKARNEINKVVDPDDVVSIIVEYSDVSEEIRTRVKRDFCKDNKKYLYVTLPKWFRGNETIEDAISYIKYIREEFLVDRLRDFNKKNVKSRFVIDFIKKHNN